MTAPNPSEADRIREVYRQRDLGGARHPAIADAYRRLNADRLIRTEALVRAVATPERGRLLDVGCGAGLDFAYWVGAGWSPDRLAGVDLVAERIERARLACPGVDLQVVDGTTLPFPDGTFDIATAVTVFSSIIDPVTRTALFREMERVVRPGGVVVIYDFVVRKPTNPHVRALGLAELRALANRPPELSVRLTPLLQLVAAGVVAGPKVADAAMRMAPRTHRLSQWRVRPATAEAAAAAPSAVSKHWPGRSTRMLIVTGLYPTADRPATGAFVAQRVEALRARGVDVVVDAVGSYRRSAWIRQLELVGRLILVHGRVDGVEGHVLFPAGLVALVAGRVHRAPVVLYAHGSDVMSTAWRNRLTEALARLVARHADRVVTNSAAAASWVARLGAAARVVSPGVDLQQFQPGGRVLARDRLGVASDARIALFVGEVDELKGADLFAAAIDAAPAWTGVMVGRGALAAAIRTRRPSIVMVGEVSHDRVPGWMQAADVVVVPSRREALGLAAIEALACGTPVIAAAVGGLIEVVRDNENGLLVPPVDVAALSAALARLLDPVLRARLAAAGPASVARFDLGEATRSMAEVWAELGVAT